MNERRREMTSFENCFFVPEAGGGGSTTTPGGPGKVTKGTQVVPEVTKLTDEPKKGELVDGRTLRIPEERKGDRLW